MKNISRINDFKEALQHDGAIFLGQIYSIKRGPVRLNKGVNMHNFLW